MSTPSKKRLNQDEIESIGTAAKKPKTNENDRYNLGFIDVSGHSQFSSEVWKHFKLIKQIHSKSNL